MSLPLRAIKQAITDFAPSQTFRFNITTVPAAVLTWIAANPGQSALLVTNGILIFTPAALTAPLLATMGFGATGPVAGEFSVLPSTVVETTVVLFVWDF